MSDEPVFRLVAMRQPTTAIQTVGEPPGGRTMLAISLHDKPESDLQLQIKTHAIAGRGPDARRLAEEAKRNGLLLSTLDGLDAGVIAALEWIQLNRRKTFNDLDFADDLTSAAGKTLQTLVISNEFKATKLKLADSLVIEATLGESSSVSSWAVEALKMLKLLEAAATDTLKANPDLTVNRFLSASTVVVPSPARSDLGTEVGPPPVRTAPAKREDIDQGAIRKRYNSLKEAREDLARQLHGKDALKVTTVSDKVSEELRARINELTQSNAVLAAALKERAPELTSFIQPLVSGAATPPLTVVTSTVVISPTALGRMKPENLRTLREIPGWEDDLDPARAMDLVDRELMTTRESITLTDPPSMYVSFGGGYIDRSLLRESVGFGRFVPLPPAVLAECDYRVGVADLLLVKQTLKAYELADFAHVENALRGELREREHRRVNLQEEIISAETERETERERNLQSTERNEMQTEATRQLRTEIGVQAGLQVSGSYGPAVSFTASLNASFATSTEESQRKATAFSREVTEKTSERVRERVREERRRRVLEQIEELNRHKIDNTVNPTGHVRGIYRWLNKIYDAQVLNYGKRMMYEFVIPQPAAFLIYTLVEHPPVDSTLPPKPEPPTFDGGPLIPQNLTRYNYQDYVAQYRITNAPAPPSEFTMIAHFDKLEGQVDPANLGRAAKIVIPEDYEATKAYVSRYIMAVPGQQLGILIGGIASDIGDVWGVRYFDFARAFRSELSISYSGGALRALGLGIDVVCRLTEEGLIRWQQKVYDAIIEAYERRRADYEEKLAASEIAQGVKIIGRNPLENRRLEQDELKKLIIMILRGSPYLNIDSFLSSSEPAMDIARVCENGKLIRFLESAFEWHNMSYLCYPYFWGRHSRWAAAIHFTDPDPDFAAFLKAGAARVQVPVRPGFETAIAHFCDTGTIPDGEATLIGGSMYVPIVQEISESLGRLDDGVPYPEGSHPWEVRLPTTLVVLQDLEEISGIRDILTGGNIRLLSQPA